jgi:hypothetical protein
MTKKVYLIRHAQSEANIASDLDNPKYYYDAPDYSSMVKNKH